MLYELRHYDTQGDRALDTLIQRFNDTTLRIWKRLNISPVGFWTVIVGAQAPRLTYILAWESLAQRETLWSQFEADAEWLREKAEAIAKSGYDPVQTIISTIMRPTPTSYIARRDNQPARLEGGTFEMRTHTFTSGEHLARTLDWYAQHGQEHQSRHGMFSMGLWTTVIGVAPRLTQMLVFESLAHRERAWAAFYTDPLWPALQAGLYDGHVPLIAATESNVMKGTEFPGWR